MRRHSGVCRTPVEIAAAFRWRMARPTGRRIFRSPPRQTIAIEPDPKGGDAARAPLWGGVAGVAELVDAVDLGSTAERRGGSSPSARTSPFDRARSASLADGLIAKFEPPARRRP